MEADDNIAFTYAGEDEIPDEVTHVLIVIGIIPPNAFNGHPSIVQVICGEGVEKIAAYAFSGCPRLKRVIMPGVKEIEKRAFQWCEALNYIECGKLEIIGEFAFNLCKSLSDIDLPSARIVETYAFNHCTNLTNAKFGKDLKSIRGGGFSLCSFLLRIALPLKDGVITDDDIFQRCENLNRVDLVEGAVLSETIAALLLEEWKNDINEDIDAINQTLGTTPAGASLSDAGGKAREIRSWVTSLLCKIVHYQAEHCCYLNMAAALEPALPNDIVLNNVLPFLAYTFDGRDLLEDEDEHSSTHELALPQGQDSVVNVEVEEQVNHQFFSSSVALSLVIVVVSISILNDSLRDDINLVGSKGFD